MKFKNYIKNKVGIHNINYLKGIYKIIKVKKNAFFKHIIINKDEVEDYYIVNRKKKNVFCGYYDYFPISNDCKKLLYQCVKKRANPNEDKSEIGYVDIKTKKYYKIIDTSAWCWQQGSRLHWSEGNNHIILYNDIDNMDYCTRMFDLNKNEIIKTIKPALYDISKNEKFGISINFSRLQRLRPGYGYYNLADETINEKAPKHDGLFYLDLKTGEKKLLVDLYSLAKSVDKSLNNNHYINHVSISPNNDKIMFFHIWTEKKWPGWMTRLCIYDLQTNSLKIIEDKKLVSHYCWIDNKKMIITCADKDNKSVEYRLYDIERNDYKVLPEKQLNEDGHPTYIGNDSFISDTYPNNNLMQTVFKYDYSKKLKTVYATVFGDPRLTGEYRCDLHPKVKKNIIVFDTTYKNNKRSILVLKLKERGEPNGKQ